MTENLLPCSEMVYPVKNGQSTLKPNRKTWRRVLLAVTTLVTAAWAWDAIRMPAKSRGLLFDDVSAIEHNRVGLVLGCVPRLPDGRQNLYLVRRIEAAARLYHAQKVDYLLVSGNANLAGQDEPAAMRQGLLALGVPEARIVVDPLGLRTLDSVARAHEVYGQSRLTLVSQRFHNERAVYIAQALGLAVVGYNAADPPRLPRDKLRLREPFARILAVLDMRVFGTQPTHLGAPIAIGEVK
jgi:SanA protein